MCALPWACAVPWGYHNACGGYLEYRGGYHETVGVILGTRGDAQYRGGYHDACGGYHEYRGGQSFIILVPHGTEHPPWYS